MVKNGRNSVLDNEREHGEGTTSKCQSSLKK